MIRQMITKLPPLARYPVARLIHCISIATLQKPSAHFLAAAVFVPLTAAVAMWVFSSLVRLLPYLLILSSAFYVALAAISFIRQSRKGR
ncbi:MAG: hypothetical protein DCF25_16075 [Leptolyngbya foveolarum]|uniref:Uncharacterized protein n=1 Tax=Leptolyngbya foveolarum TaxID=47253 RepID=A0A2W4TXW8_9CYAN|nr:MAG: hypothetical protein DCF25_16075 [Leptolyngbya foveolarum]